MNSEKNRQGLTYLEWLVSAGKSKADLHLSLYWEAWEAGEDPGQWNAPIKPFLFGYSYTWQEDHPFTVLAVVLAVNPIEATAKYESDSDRAYAMSEINLVGGAIWEARESLVVH